MRRALSPPNCRVSTPAAGHVAVGGEQQERSGNRDQPRSDVEELVQSTNVETEADAFCPMNDGEIGS
jgi:hypothetical protein